MNSRSPAAPLPFSTHLLPLVLLIIASLAVFAPSLQHDFLTNWDDPLYVTANQAAQGITLPHLKAAFTRYFAGNYAPLQIVSYMVDYQIWGMRASGYILTNILIHILNGVLLYQLLIYSRFSRWTACFAAALFLLHPVQVESVVWVSQRKNVLALLFFLVSFNSYLHYANTPPDQTKPTRWYLLSLLTFAGALLSKSAAVVLPVALVFYDICYTSFPAAKKQLQNKLPYLLFALACAAITMIAQQPDINSTQAGGAVPYHGGSPYYTFLTMLPVMLLYVKNLLLPFNLSPVYLAQIRQGIDGEVVAGMVLVLAYCAYGIRLYSKNRTMAFWYSLIVICLLPVLQIVPLATLINDRYLYFPMLGIAPFVAHLLFEKLPAQLFPEESFSTRTPPVIGALAVLLLIFFSWLTYQRSTVWRTTITLWNDTVRTNTNIDIRFSQADAYHSSKDLNSARRMYEQILAEAPNHRPTLRNLATLYMQQGNPLAARPLLLTLTRLYPDYAFAFATLGNNYYMTGDAANAEINYRKSLAIKADQPELFMPLGNILLAKRQLDSAQQYLSKAVAAAPNNPELHYSLACLYSLTGNTSQALRSLEAALSYGYHNERSLLSNPELAAIRTMPDFQRLLAAYRVK